jgi:hypothetical protein
MSLSRKFAVAFVGSDLSIKQLCAGQLSLAEAFAWLESHQRAPSPDGQPCVLLNPLSREIESAISKLGRE